MIPVVFRTLNNKKQFPARKLASLLLAILFGATHFASAGIVAANFNSASDVPVTATSYIAAGNELELSLNFAPVTAANLTVVSNTGLNFTVGEFSNLTHGQVVGMPYGGLTYQFVANYYGGTGNDLVLEWFRREMHSWGSNNYGQLGQGTVSAKGEIPAAVSPGILLGKTVISTSAGSSSSVALCSDGTLAIWGSLDFDTGTYRSSAPIAVSTTGALAGKNVIAVSAGSFHFLALCSDGTVVSWGRNSSGQLGDGTQTTRLAPVNVIQTGVLAGKTVVAVSAGSYHSLALCSDGQVVAWGSNSNGNLGTGAFGGFQAQPVGVPKNGVLNGKTVVALAAGGFHSLTLCSDGTLVTWGGNSSGQLGDGSTVNSPFPVAVSSTGALGEKTISAINAGSDHNLILCSDNTLLTWGNNILGQLGNGQTGNQTTPVEVDQTGVLAGKSVARVTAGGVSNFALCSDGTLASWGGNADGQLGTGTGSLSRIPVLVKTSGVLAAREVVSISAGGSHSLVISAVPLNSKLSGLALSSGILNPPFSPDVHTYVASMPGTAAGVTVTPTSQSPFSAIHVNGVAVVSGSPSQPAILSGSDISISIVVQSENGAPAITYTVTTPTGINANFLSDADVPATLAGYEPSGWQASLTLGFAPALGTNLTVINNTSLGFIQGRFTNLAHGQVLELPFNNKNYRFVANYYGGTGNDLVLEWSHRRVLSWGRNDFRQLGNGSSVDSPVPVSVIHSGVLAGKTVLSVVSCYATCHALCSDGTVVGWGNGLSGELGTGSNIISNIPVVVSGLGALAGKQVTSLAAGNNTVLAICSDGTIASWGSNSNGQLGNGSSASSNIPVSVTRTTGLAGKTPVAAAVGGFHCIVLCSDGTMVSWGGNSKGQLGNRGPSADVRVPRAVYAGGVLAGKTAVAVGAGGFHSMALCSDGTVVTWGDNTGGEQGAGNPVNYIAWDPVLVKRDGILSGKTVINISANGRTCLTGCSDGTIASWGVNSQGSVGNGGSSVSLIPREVDSSGVLAGRTVVGIGQGDYVGFAIFQDGSAAGWGNNSYGQVGDGSPTFRPKPVLLESKGELYGKKVLSISGGGLHAHAVIAEPDAGYISWMAGRPGVANKTEFADSEADGIPNLMEYVLNGDPAVSSTGILPTVSADGTDYVFTFDRLASSDADTVQIFQTSTDMINWTAIRISLPADPRVKIGAGNGSSNQAVTVTIPKVSGEHMFGRLRVSLP